MWPFSCEISSSSGDVNATGRGEDAEWIAQGAFRMGEEVELVELTVIMVPIASEMHWLNLLHSFKILLSVVLNFRQK
jgi:hypothetical protein